MNEHSGENRHLHRWATEGQEWACGVYDHGPFCRLCQPVDATLNACLTNVDEGLFDWRVGPDGKFSFRLTPKGLAQVDQITAVPAVAELLDALEPGWRQQRDEGGQKRCKLHGIRGCAPCEGVFGRDA